MEFPLSAVAAVRSPALTVGLDGDGLLQAWVLQGADMLGRHHGIYPHTCTGWLAALCTAEAGDVTQAATGSAERVGPGVGCPPSSLHEQGTVGSLWIGGCAWSLPQPGVAVGVRLSFTLGSGRMTMACHQSTMRG